MQTGRQRAPHCLGISGESSQTKRCWSDFLTLTLGSQAACPHTAPERRQAQKGTLDKAFPWEGATE